MWRPFYNSVRQFVPPYEPRLLPGANATIRFGSWASLIRWAVACLCHYTSINIHKRIIPCKVFYCMYIYNSNTLRPFFSNQSLISWNASYIYLLWCIFIGYVLHRSLRFLVIIWHIKYSISDLIPIITAHTSQFIKFAFLFSFTYLQWKWTKWIYL